MSTANKLTYLNQTKQKLKQAINNIGGEVTDETTFRNYVNQLENAYDRLPKTEFEEGESVTLENTLKGKLDFDNGVVGIGQSEQVILPSEYQQVEYIESTGTQFLTTNTYINNNNISIKTKITTPNMPSMEQDIIGNQDNTTGRFILGLYNNIVFGYSRNNIGADANVISTSYSGKQTLEIELDYNYSSSKKTLKVNDTSYDMAYTQSISNSNNAVQIFGNGNGENRLVGKVYYLKLYKGDTLSIDLYPCYRISDNVIGMYDLVTSTFYTNQGTGTFTKGANAPTPNAEIPINSVTGNQDVVVSGKNEFDNNSVPITIVQETSVEKIDTGIKVKYTGNTSKSTTYYAGFKILDLSNHVGKTIRCKCNFQASGSNVPRYYIALCDENGGSREQKAVGTTNGQELSFVVPTISGNAKYLILVLYSVFNSTIEPNGYVDYTNIILTIDNADTTYEPYITPITNQLSLGDIQLCAIGNYKDELIYDVENDKVYKNEKIKKVVFNGTENWSRSGGTTETVFVGALSISGAVDHNGLSNYFTHSNYTNANTFDVYNNGNNLALRFNISQISDVASLKTWLSTHNTEVYCQKATATLTEITDTTLKAQVKAWYYGQSLDGTTIIEGNGDLPMIIKVRGLKGE